ncbi:sensor histidine kinase [Edaphobacter aggregans]|uniref:sensor histidine kinase n=1 Tax=Edaphobacter aggregans TaxID=570835 RepID=UPI00054D439B|nr:sensor histidine kinase [Edaphobacter aggregans]
MHIAERTAAALNPEQKITQYSLTQWGHRDGLPSTAIYAVAQTRDGFLWLGTSDGLVRFDGLHFVQVPLSETGDIAFGRVQALKVDRTGAMWIGTENGSLVRMEGRSMKVVMLDMPIVALRENADSSIEVKISDHLLRFDTRSMELKSRDLETTERSSKDQISGCLACAGFGNTSAILQRADLGQNQIRTAIRDHDGNVWIATKEGGVLRIPRRSNGSSDVPSEVDRLTARDGLSNDSVWDIFEDREHNLWIATQNGLNRLRDDKISMVTRRTGILSNDISSLVSTPAGIFAGSNLGLDRVTATHCETSLRGSIFSLARASDGALLFATSLGLSQLKNGKVSLVPLGVKVNHITVLFQGSSGELWFYDQDKGLYRWRDGQTASRIIDPALSNKSVSAMVADSRGGVWLGLTAGEIVLYDGAGFRTFTEADRLPGGMLHSISAGNDGSVWIAFERGLALFTGDRFISWSKKNGLPGERVLWAMPTPAGRLWVGYNIGIASMRIEDLRHAATDTHFLVPYDFYDDGDGLKANPELRGSTPVAMAPNGRIWFTTSEGLATIDPAHLRKNLLPPPVHVLQLTADDADVDLRSSITLPPRTHRIEINYSGLSLTDPRKVTFRYRMLGFDPRWSQASTRRFATYTNLPPGNYRFEVMAANEDGIWNETPSGVAFKLAPAVYQTKWFLGLCVLALILAGVLVFRLRVRAAADRLRLRFEERLGERTRVAQDLHDNLLQELMGISLQLEIADELTPPGAPGKPTLKRALQLSKSALTHGRGALTTLRVTTFTQRDILQALSLAAAAFPEERRSAVQYRTHGEQLPVRAGIGEEITQIGREALRNALQHTQGTVRVSIHYASSRFCLIIDDEGQGISRTIMESGVPGHFGLRGMRERAARIASMLTIESKMHGGTHVKLSVPASMAYAGFDTKSGLWARFRARWGTRKQAVEEVNGDE